ncbi:MAG: orotate phosphoribosyltransferase [Candidatus Paceibacterota bacterium]|jgi:orotate phosphoribosyltransferase
MNVEQRVAQELIKIGAVKFVLENPITFKSGIVAPIYIDNREFPFHPSSWKVVIESFQELIKKNNINFDIIAGVAVGGIPHSAALGFSLNKPSIFIRKEAKDHGTKSLVEGGNIKGKKVILIEDLVSTGGSSLNAVKEIRNAEGIVNECLVIVGYDFMEAKENFKNNDVKLFTLTSVPVILEEAFKLGQLKEEQMKKIKEWFLDPHKLSNK